MRQHGMPDLSGHFQNDDEVIHAVEEYLEAPNVIFLCEGIAKLENPWKLKQTVKK